MSQDPISNKFIPQLKSLPKNKKTAFAKAWAVAVIRTGFKPVTYCLEGNCSIQLSYRTFEMGPQIN